MKNFLLLALALVMTTPAFSEEKAPNQETPASAPAFTGKQLDIQKKMEGLFEQSKHVNHLEAKKRNEARAAIGTALDWEKVAEDAIGSAEWRKLSGGNRNAFRDLLKDVIERTAYTRLDKFWEGGTTSAIEKIDLAGNKAHVVGKFTVKNEPFTLEYYLYSKGSKWMIYDLAFEGERYSININEQITAYLAEKNFNSLLDKLRKRQAELKADGAKPAKSKG